MLSGILWAATPLEIYENRNDRNQPKYLWTCYMSLERTTSGLRSPFSRPPKWAKYTPWSGLNKWVSRAKAAGLSPKSCLDLADNYRVRNDALRKDNGTNSYLSYSFNILNPNDRKLIQSTLKSKGYYNSSIDGLYGPGTEGALKAYNQAYLKGSDLGNQENVKIL